MSEVNLPFPPALWDDLSLVDPQKASQNSGATFEDGRFTIDFLCAPFIVDVKQRLVLGPPNRLKADFQRALVLVVHLTHCGQTDPPDPSGRLIGTMEVPGGAMFFRGPHEVATAPLAEAYPTTPELLAVKAFTRGAEESSQYLFTWQVLPKVQIACVFDPQDEEFPAQAGYLVDSHAHFYLPLDALWGLLNVVTLELLP